jgi:uncharacterized protein (DUF58 family)
MGASAVANSELLPQAELIRVAHILSRFLAGQQPSAVSTQVAGRAAGHGLDFLDFRSYQPGDDVRRIDWRASARGRDVLVRRYCGDMASDWHLCVDASASMSVAGAAKWQLASQFTAALAYVLLSLGHRVGVVLFSARVDARCPLGRGPAQYAHILGLLNSHAPRLAGGGSDPGTCAALLGRAQPLFVVSDFLAEDAMLPALSALRSRHREMHMLQVNAPGDLQLPAAADLLLQDVESGRTVHCVETDPARKRAALRLQAAQEQLRGWSRRYGVPLTSCSCDDSWRDVILRHFLDR